MAHCPICAVSFSVGRSLARAILLLNAFLLFARAYVWTFFFLLVSSFYAALIASLCESLSLRVVMAHRPICTLAHLCAAVLLGAVSFSVRRSFARYIVTQSYSFARSFFPTNLFLFIVSSFHAALIASLRVDRCFAVTVLCASSRVHLFMRSPFPLPLCSFSAAVVFVRVRGILLLLLPLRRYEQITYYYGTLYSPSQLSGIDTLRFTPCRPSDVVWLWRFGFSCRVPLRVQYSSTLCFRSYGTVV